MLTLVLVRINLYCVLFTILSTIVAKVHLCVEFSKINGLDCVKNPNIVHKPIESTGFSILLERCKVCARSRFIGMKCQIAGSSTYICGFAITCHNESQQCYTRVCERRLFKFWHISRARTVGPQGQYLQPILDQDAKGTEHLSPLLAVQCWTYGMITITK